MWRTLREHWPEYLIEGWGLGTFMIVAGSFATLFFSPVSPFVGIPLLLRHGWMGMIMGLTAMALIYSPWGKRSGAHLNPSVSLTFYRLGKLAGWDTVFYVLAQIGGGVFGILLVALGLKQLFLDPPVHSIVTIPGQWGILAAFVAEFLMAFGLMLLVLLVSNTARIAQLTGLFAGILIAFYITFASPLSGMSLNPARTFASALVAHLWTGFWIYLLAPPLGMLSAAELYQDYPHKPAVICGKLCPNTQTPCLAPECCCQPFNSP